MSVFVLKLIAVVSMFVDHLTYVSLLSGLLPRGTLYTVGRSIGRQAFVIFCFLLVNGFDKTRDRKKYLTRLVLFAVISQFPFSLAFTAGNYRSACAAGFSFDALTALALLFPLAVSFFTLCGRRFSALFVSLAAAFALCAIHWEAGGVCLFGGEMNVFYTLAASMAAMMCLEYLFSEGKDWPRALLLLAALAVEYYFVQRKADYGLMGAALVLLLFLTRKQKALQLVAAALWCVLEYRLKIPYLCGALCAILPLALYNGRPGKNVKRIFYLFYPAHIALLGLVFLFFLK